MENIISMQDFIKEIRSLQDLETLAAKVKESLESNQISFQEKKDLEKIRQRIYEKKHKIKKKDSSHHSIITINQVNKIDQESFFKKNILKIILLLFSSIFFSYVSWDQSFLLYKTLGFDNAGVISFASLGMSIIPILLLQRIDRRLLYPFILVIFFYEFFLVTSVTLINEENNKSQNLKKDMQYLFFIEDYKKSQDEYLIHKKRFNQEKSKYYMNTWYKDKYLNPSWQRVQIGLARIKEYEEKALQISEIKTKKFLKILFRLIIITILMLSIKEIQYLLIIFSKKDLNSCAKNQ